MNPFSFYLGASPVSTVMYIVLWIAVLVVLYKANFAKRIPGNVKVIVMIVLAAFIASITLKVGHRQASLDRQQFDTPSFSNQKEMVPSSRMSRADAEKSLETQINKTREENTK